MTVQEIMNELDNHGFSYVDDNVKLSVINEVLWDVAALEPWAHLQKTVTLTFSGSSTVPVSMPTDFVGLSALSRTDTNTPLFRWEEEKWARTYGASTEPTGHPRLYYFAGTTLNVWPAPGGSVSVRMSYLSRPAAVVQAGAENTIWLPPAFHRSIVVPGGLAQLHLLNRDYKESEQLMVLFDRGVARATKSLKILDYIDSPIDTHMASVPMPPKEEDVGQ